MKQVFKMAPLALAVAAISFSGVVAAMGDGDGQHQEGASISKHVHVSKHVKYAGEVGIAGYIRVDSLGMAVIDDKQYSGGNYVNNVNADNDATLDGNALKDSKGNIGVNIGAGDNNVQGNSAALAAADASFVFGSADAEVFIDQSAEYNGTWNLGTVNDAGFGGNALQGAMGNIGVNIAAGSSNVQKNAFAGAVASGSMGEATIAVNQGTGYNTTHNYADQSREITRTDISVSGDLHGTYNGGSTSGRYETVGSTYAGDSVQSNAVYPEVWVGGDHGAGTSQSGHIDFDNLNGSGTGDEQGTFEFAEEGTITPNARSGRLEFSEAGDTWLGGTLTGQVVHTVVHYTRHENNASMGNNALQGAKGNIGVNIAAGSNNLQNNSLAISRLSGSGVIEQ